MAIILDTWNVIKMQRRFVGFDPAVVLVAFMKSVSYVTCRVLSCFFLLNEQNTSVLNKELLATFLVVSLEKEIIVLLYMGAIKFMFKEYVLK